MPLTPTAPCGGPSRPATAFARLPLAAPTEPSVSARTMGGSSPRTPTGPSNGACRCTADRRGAATRFPRHRPSARMAPYTSWRTVWSRWTRALPFAGSTDQGAPQAPQSSKPMVRSSQLGTCFRNPLKGSCAGSPRPTRATARSKAPPGPQRGATGPTPGGRAGECELRAWKRWSWGPDAARVRPRPSPATSEKRPVTKRPSRDISK